VPVNTNQFWAGLLVFCLLPGCGGQTVPINGRVKFKDGSDVSVLRGYEVNMQAEGGGASSYGTIEADGTFKISTFGNNDGAVPGKHQVTVSPPPPEPDQPPPKPAIPPKYSSFETSGLTVDVQSGQGTVDLGLERAP
jgi:hypothetical protein